MANTATAVNIQLQNVEGLAETLMASRGRWLNEDELQLIYDNAKEFTLSSDWPINDTAGLYFYDRLCIVDTNPDWNPIESLMTDGNVFAYTRTTRNLPDGNVHERRVYRSQSRYGRIALVHYRIIPPPNPPAA